MEVKLHLRAVDMAVLTHYHGLDTAAIHFSDHLRSANHCPLRLFPNMVPKVRMNTIKSTLGDMCLTYHNSSS